jgi:hypothetical protein
VAYEMPHPKKAREGTLSVSPRAGEDWHPCAGGCQSSHGGPLMTKFQVAVLGWPVKGINGSNWWCKQCVAEMCHDWDQALMNWVADDEIAAVAA